MGEKVAVIYKSKYGATKRYAGWIALKLDADLYEVSDIGKNDLKEYDTIIYGGSIYNEKIKGVKFITSSYKNIKDKIIYVFMVGIKSFDEKYINYVLEKSIPKDILSNIDTFYFRGKINYKELSIKDKILINSLKLDVLDNQETDTLNDDKMIFKLQNSLLDYIDKKYIDRLLNSVLSNG